MTLEERRQKAIAKVIAIALSDVNYVEKETNADLDSKSANPGDNNYTKFGRDLVNEVGAPYANGVAWCDEAFDDWQIRAFGVETAKKLLGGWSAYTPTSAQYYKNINQWFTDPLPGDQVFFKNSKEICHTGLVTSVKDGLVYTVEGNTSSAPGVVANGGAVATKRYPLGYAGFAGFGRPDYSIVEFNDEEEDNMKYYAKLTDIPDDWDKKRPGYPRSLINTFMNVGLLCGDNSDPKGNNDVIDLSQDMLRMVIINVKAGVYDTYLQSHGVDPNTLR